MIKIDFEDTRTAFSIKSNRDLRRAHILFKLISYPILVKIGNPVIKVFSAFRIPIGWIVKPTAFKHFVGGETLEECQPAVEKLKTANVYSILDYSIEGKETDKAIEEALQETLRAVKNAGSNPDIPFAVFKPTAFGKHHSLEVLSGRGTPDEKILKEFPETILIIAPRHIERIHAIGALVEKRGLGYQLWTDLDKDKAKRTEQVVIINAFGELFKIYSVGTIVFCGGSLVPLGGQNPLEPAAWGKAVFYGPSMENFMDAKSLLEANKAGLPISSPEMLAEKAVWFLGHPEELKAYGERGRAAILKNKGAGEKHAGVIMRLWESVANA